MSNRREGELIIFECKDSGEKLPIRRISPYLLLELEKMIPMPKPPMQEVDYGDGQKRLEPNPSHPDYQLALQEYQRKTEKAMRRLLIQRGVALEMTEERLAKNKEVREYMLSEFGIEMDEKDERVFYVTYVAIGSEDDLNDLMNAVLRRSQPTEAAIAENIDRFQG